MHGTWWGIVLIAATVLPGCFSERSFPAVEARLARLAPADVQAGGQRLGVRAWAPLAHARMEKLLPANSRPAVTSADLAGAPVDVYGRMKINRATVDNLLCNLDGMQQTAQISSPPTDKAHPALPWDGWQSVEIPMADGAKLCGRFAPPTGTDLGGSFVVMTHGLFGTMEGHDVHNQVAALRHAGHHVLVVEMRGHGETLAKYPDEGITFGVCESTDLLTIARWLKAEHAATRVGLLSFSLTGCESLLAAWLDAGGREECNAAGSQLFVKLPTAREAAPAYNGGIFIVSPPVNMAETTTAFDQPYNLLSGTVKSVFQQKCSERMAARGEAPSHHMSDFIASEYRHAQLDRRFPDIKLYERDLRMLTDLDGEQWAVGRRRMEELRTPVLILAAGNDPLGTAQSVADLATGVKNENFGVIILPQGGHMGFPVVSADYYYSLVLSFFDPAAGPVGK